MYERTFGAKPVSGIAPFLADELAKTKREAEQRALTVREQKDAITVGSFFATLAIELLRAIARANLAAVEKDPPGAGKANPSGAARPKGVELELVPKRAKARGRPRRG